MKNGLAYVEAAHIIPKSDKGTESPDNIILLCPNHHKEFDLGHLEIINHNHEHVDFIMNKIYYSVSLRIN